MYFYMVSCVTCPLDSQQIRNPIPIVVNYCPMEVSCLICGIDGRGDLDGVLFVLARSTKLMYFDFAASVSHLASLPLRYSVLIVVPYCPMEVSCPICGTDGRGDLE